MNNDDIAPLYDEAPDAPPPMSLRQGIVQSWNGDTGENSIQMGGAVLVNLPSLTAESASLVAGDVVSLLTVGDRALVLGKTTTPGDPGTVPTWNADLQALAPLTDLAAITSGTTVTGATQSTAGSGPRVVINDPAYPGQIVMYTADPTEVEPARLFPIISGNTAYMRLVGPKTTGMAGTPASFDLLAITDTNLRKIEEDADAYHLFSNDTVIDGFTQVRIGDGTDYVTFVGKLVTNADLSSPTNAFPANPQPVIVSEGTDITGIVNTSFAAGTPVCGTSFTAPATGKVYVVTSAHAESQASGTNVYVGFELRTGSTVGSGTVVRAASTDSAVAAGTTTGTRDRINASRRALVTGLTPGAAYNVQTMHLSDGGGACAVFYRELLVEPVL